MNGKFYVFNVNAALKDSTDSWVKPPKGKEVDLNLAISYHSHVIESINGEDVECDEIAPKEVDLFKNMKNWDNISKLGDKQAEEYFCSKECLISWFTDQIKGL
jgi:hypothetical protein